MRTRLAKAIPHSTALERRRTVPCPKCGANPHEPCRRRIPERYTTFNEGTVQGEGRWKYYKTLHPERLDPTPQGRPYSRTERPP